MPFGPIKPNALHENAVGCNRSQNQKSEKGVSPEFADLEPADQAVFEQIDQYRT